MNETIDPPLPPAPGALCRLPGLFRRWELAQVIEAGETYRFEDAGIAGDGTPLFFVYRSGAGPSENSREETAP